MGQLDPEEARTLADGIREEWAVLSSLLEEAEEAEAWRAAGFDRPEDWIGELGPLPPLALRVGGMETGRARTARVSRPGANVDASLRAGR